MSRIFRGQKEIEDTWRLNETDHIVRTTLRYYGVTGTIDRLGFTGPQGVQGLFGTQGNQGNQGWQGLQGLQGGEGNEGWDGYSGALGHTGLQGQQGQQGLQGYQCGVGTQGLKGVDGTVGTNGLPGIQGSQGIQGNQGSTGSGLLGWQGIDGTAAVGGCSGNQGTIGTQGFQNISGTTGIQGAQGLPGPTGVTGPQGVQGNVGLGGNQGAQGSNGFIGVDTYDGCVGVQGNVGAGGNLGFQGPQGDQGITGVMGRQGNQSAIGFQGSQGSQGDGFQGSQGIEGSATSIGVQGIQGVQGQQGLQGSQGFQGGIGTMGNQGLDGNLGLTGPQGQQGSQGSQGRQGNAGSVISIGVTGSVGYQGTQGTQGPQGIAGSATFPGPAGEAGVYGNQGQQGVAGGVASVGATGAAGLQGNQGTIGVVGLAGGANSLGVTGSLGFQGNQSSWGPQGVAGSALNTGPAGVQGVTGPSLTQGTQGSSGLLGHCGIQGLQGPQAATGMGVQGFKGITGGSGVQGLQGYQGGDGGSNFAHTGSSLVTSWKERRQIHQATNMSLMPELYYQGWSSCGVNGGLAISTTITHMKLTQDGEVLMVGNHTATSNTGVVRVYRRSTPDGSSWDLEASINRPTASPNGKEFGNGIDMTPDGRYALIAATNADPTTSVHIYQRIGPSWDNHQLLFSVNQGDATPPQPFCVHLSYDATYFSVLDDGVIQVWRRTSPLVNTWTSTGMATFTMATTSNYCAMAQFTGHIIAENVGTGVVAHEFSMIDGSVISSNVVINAAAHDIMAISPCGSYAASCDNAVDNSSVTIYRRVADNNDSNSWTIADVITRPHSNEDGYWGQYLRFTTNGEFLIIKSRSDNTNAVSEAITVVANTGHGHFGIVRHLRNVGSEGGVVVTLNGRGLNIISGHSNNQVENYGGTSLISHIFGAASQSSSSLPRNREDVWSSGQNQLVTDSVQGRVHPNITHFKQWSTTITTPTGNTSLRLTDNGEYLVIGGGTDGGNRQPILIYHSETAGEQWTQVQSLNPEGSSGDGYVGRISGCGNRLVIARATSSNNVGPVWTYDKVPGEHRWSFVSTQTSIVVTQCDLSRDGQFLIVCSGNNGINGATHVLYRWCGDQWVLNDGTINKTTVSSTSFISIANCDQVSDDGYFVADTGSSPSANSEFVVGHWDILTGEQLTSSSVYTLNASSQPTRCCISSCGHFLAVTSSGSGASGSNTNIEVWRRTNVNTWTRSQTLREPSVLGLVHSNSSTCNMKFTPDATWLMVGYANTSTNEGQIVIYRRDSSGQCFHFQTVTKNTTTTNNFGERAHIALHKEMGLMVVGTRGSVIETLISGGYHKNQGQKTGQHLLVNDSLTAFTIDQSSNGTTLVHNSSSNLTCTLSTTVLHGFQITIINANSTASVTINSDSGNQQQVRLSDNTLSSAQSSLVLPSSQQYRRADFTYHQPMDQWMVYLFR
jgi:hypothetical protein